MLNAKLEAVEARTDTKFAQLISKIDTLGERFTGLQTQITHLDGRITHLDNRITQLDDRIAQLDAKITGVDEHARNSKSLIVATALGTGIAVAALSYAAVQVFQGGMGATANAFQAGMAVAQAHAGDQPSSGPRTR